MQVDKELRKQLDLQLDNPNCNKHERSVRLPIPECCCFCCRSYFNLIPSTPLRPTLQSLTKSAKTRPSKSEKVSDANVLILQFRCVKLIPFIAAFRHVHLYDFVQLQTICTPTWDQAQHLAIVIKRNLISVSIEIFPFLYFPQLLMILISWDLEAPWKNRSYRSYCKCLNSRQKPKPAEAAVWP